VESISVIIPTLNEGRNIGRVLDKIPAFVSEIIVVDGFSSDDTSDTVAHHPRGVVLVHQAVRGKGAAMLTGLHYATGDIIVFLDADGSMNPEEIGEFCSAFTSGSEVVKGSRHLAGGGSDDFTWVRKLGNGVLTRIANSLFQVRWTDFAYGYFAVRRDVAEKLDLNAMIEELAHVATTVKPPHKSTHALEFQHGHGFEIEALFFCRAARRKLDIREVPSFEHPRQHGESNLKVVSDGIRVARVLLRERFL